MSAPEPTFDRLLTSIEKRERASRRNAILWTVIPAAAAFALLGYSSWRLQTASEKVSALAQTARAYEQQAQEAKQEVAELTVETDQLRQEARSVRAQLEQTEKLLRQTLELSQYRFTVTPVDVKHIASRFPREARLLDFIIHLGEQNVGWRLGGQSPAQGFDSPSFAEYVMRRFDLDSGAATAGLPLIEASRKLYDRLPRTDSPRVGDLAFYPAGYVLFYFVTEHDEPFVIGMTPFGITALKHDFAEVIGYRRPTR